MHRANKPTGGHVVIQSLPGGRGLDSGSSVNEGEHDAGNDLQHEDHQRRAAKNIKPAGGVARDLVPGGFLDGGVDGQADAEPIDHGFDQAHGFISRTISEFFDLQALPGVGISSALMKSLPDSSL